MKPSWRRVAERNRATVTGVKARRTYPRAAGAGYKSSVTLKIQLALTTGPFRRHAGWRASRKAERRLY